MRLLCESTWYPYQKPPDEVSPVLATGLSWFPRSLKDSITSLMAAVALATKTRSKCSGSAPKNRRARSRVSSTTWPESLAGVDAECGLPYRFVTKSAAKLSMRDLAYIVVPPWSMYVFPVKLLD